MPQREKLRRTSTCGCAIRDASQLDRSLVSLHTARQAAILRITQSNSSSGAKSYFGSGDYYAQGQETVGRWFGKGAERLGLEGEVGKKDWDALCDNKDPATGRKLTARQKENRRVGYDFTWDCPKSVSVLYGLTRDDRLLQAFESAVDETMCDIEQEVQVRVRKDGRDGDRASGNLVGGRYVHFTSRPVNGEPDPQLHAHCFVFNATYDKQESRWKAIQVGRIKAEAPYWQALADARLARKLGDLGLEVERTRTGWQLKGWSPSTLDKFSRRTAEIEKEAKAKGITDPKAKAALGAKTRENKVKQLSMDELRCRWRDRLADDELNSVHRQAMAIGLEAVRQEPTAANEAVLLAAEHCFERSAVVPERRLLAETLKRAVGKASAESVLDAYQRVGFITATRDGERLVTSREVLAQESAIVNLARQGRGSCRTFAAHDRAFTRSWLDDDQKRAVRHIWSSRDKYLVIRGAAGTGKTTMLQEAREGIEAGPTCRRVHAFAPSAGATGVLKEAGFQDATTVARLLVDPQMQERVKGQTWVIDEAGQLSTTDAAELFALAERSQARLILLGDRKQHSSVARTGLLKLLEEEAGLPTASLMQVKRQQHAEYKSAVKALSEGRTEDGFRKLDKLGWIHETSEYDRCQKVADAYIKSLGQPGETLIIAPSHREGYLLTLHLRAALKSAGKIGKDEREFTVLRPVNLTVAERRDRTSYAPGDVVVFHQNAMGNHRKGQRLVVGRDEIPFDQAERFMVFRPDTLKLATGDRIRITRNRSVSGQSRLNNGDLFTVSGFTQSGDIRLDGGGVISKDWGFIASGFAITSFAAQGKTAARVLICQSGPSMPASSAEQWYVSISRGRYEAQVFTHSKLELLDSVSRHDDRLTATELVNQHLPVQMQPYGREHRQTTLSYGRPTPTLEQVHAR